MGVDLGTFHKIFQIEMSKPVDDAIMNQVQTIISSNAAYIGIGEVALDDALLTPELAESCTGRRRSDGAQCP